MLKNEYQKEKNKAKMTKFFTNLITGLMATAFLGAVLYFLWNELIFGQITYYQAVLMTVLIRFIVAIGMLGRK